MKMKCVHDIKTKMKSTVPSKYLHETTNQFKSSIFKTSTLQKQILFTCENVFFNINPH